MIDQAKFAHFLMLGQAADRTLSKLEKLAPSESLRIGPQHDLARMLPEHLRDANRAAETYRLFFVFENYLRDFVIEVLSSDPAVTWWDKLPKDVQDEITKLAETEETKSWMAVGSRDKSALMTYPQLLRVMEHNWKDAFEELVRDRTLLQEARLIAHLRNTTCHMTTVPEEEVQRVRQTMRDWFRVVAP
jgi:Swt1-like HEPN